MSYDQPPSKDALVLSSERWTRVAIGEGSTRLQPFRKLRLRRALRRGQFGRALRLLRPGEQYRQGDAVVGSWTVSAEPHRPVDGES